MRTIEETLSEIPANRSLDDIYQRTLDSLAHNCDQEDMDVAREIFTWTLCSPRPLNLDELTAALEASMDTSMMDVERAVKETCGSLIEVVDVDSQKQVMAVHITLREFMQSDNATGCFAFEKAKAHAHIARTCLNYLLRPQFAKPFTIERDGKMDPVDVAEKYPLLNYASRYWSYHLVHNMERFDSEMNALILRFLQSRNVLTCIEAIATFGNLAQLMRMSDNLRTWLSFVPSTQPPQRRWISVLPLADVVESPSENVVSRWALDFRRMKQRFQQDLVPFPRVIHDSLPSFCPTNSMLFQRGAVHAEISMAQPSSQTKEWDNCLSMFYLPGFVRSMVCSPRRPYIASAVDSSVITIWDAETGQAIRPLQGHKDHVYALAYSKDEEYLASGGKDEVIIVWNVERGHELFRLTGHSGTIHSLAYNYSGEQLASAGADGTVRIWRVSEDGGKEQFVLSGHIGTVYTLQYHTDDVHLVSSAEDGHVVVWNAIRGTRLRKFDANLKWNGRLSLHPSRYFVLTSSEMEPNNLQIWNTKTCQLESSIITPSGVRCWKYSPCGTYIVSGHLDGRVRVWKAATGEQLHTICEDAWSLRFSNSGKYLVCLIRYISRWQVRTWDFEDEMRGAYQRLKCGCGCNSKKKNYRVIHALTVNMDNSRLATVTIPYTGAWNGQVKLWNPGTAEVVWQQDQIIRNHDCVSPGFSPDGKFLGCYDGKEDGGIHLVDAIQAIVLERIHIPPSIRMVSLAVDVNGRGLAIATREPDILSDPDNPATARFFLSRRSSGSVTTRPVDVVRTWGTQSSMALSYTADGTKLLLAARDFRDNLIVVVWDTETRVLINRVVYDEEVYIWFKMFGGFRLQSHDRIVLHVDYMPRDAHRRSIWQERMLVLSPDGGEVQRFEAGSSRMTISENRIIFLDSLYWVCSWDGEGVVKRHVKLPVDIGFAVSGLSYCDGKLSLISRTEEITVVEIQSLDECLRC
jgi:WD40 repeat protein